MIRFTSLLLFRSMRWVAPALLAALWTAVAMSPGAETTVSRAGGMFLCYVIVGCWLTILIGNVDDDAHRELVTAVVGTRARLHVVRTVTALVWCATFAVVITAISLVVHRRAHGIAVESLAALALAVSGALIGVALGAPLHRPSIRNQAASLLIALGCLAVLVQLPPIQGIMRRAGRDDISQVPTLLIVAVVVALASTGASAVASEHRRT